MADHRYPEVWIYKGRLFGAPEAESLRAMGREPVRYVPEDTSLLADLEAEVETFRRESRAPEVDSAARLRADLDADRLQALIDKHKPNGAEEACENCGGTEIERRQGCGEWIEEPCPDCAEPEQGAEGEEQVEAKVAELLEWVEGQGASAHLATGFGLTPTDAYAEVANHIRELYPALSTQPFSETTPNPGGEDD